jgi:hypothetical protein
LIKHKTPSDNPPHTDLVAIGICEVAWTREDDENDQSSATSRVTDKGLFGMLQRHLGHHFVEVSFHEKDKTRLPFVE